jgi:hypothetical protein
MAETKKYEGKVVGYVVKVHGKYLGSHEGHKWLAYKSLQHAQRAAATVSGKIHCVTQVHTKLAGVSTFADYRICPEPHTAPVRKKKRS